MNTVISIVVTKLLDWLLARLGAWYDKVEKQVEARKDTKGAIKDAEKDNNTDGIFSDKS